MTAVTVVPEKTRTVFWSNERFATANTNVIFDSRGGEVGCGTTVLWACPVEVPCTGGVFEAVAATTVGEGGGVIEEETVGDGTSTVVGEFGGVAEVALVGPRIIGDGVGSSAPPPEHEKHPKRANAVTCVSQNNRTGEATRNTGRPKRPPHEGLVLEIEIIKLGVGTGRR